MSVELEAVLALLPEMFPGVQSIPLKNVRPDPENPGPPLTDQAIQDMADNLAARDLVNQIKVQPDKANPLVEGVQPHPDNPRLRADGQPWTVGDFNYVILAGERRYRAADRLHWPAIPGFILNPTAEEAVEINYLDNDVRDRGWWAGYQSIENLVKANPSLTQRQVGTRLKMDQPKVSRALQLLPLLNPEARALIDANCINSNKGIPGISESAVLRLADLGPGSALKPGEKKADDTQKLWPYPAIPPETQDLVRRTLQVAIDEQMTEAGVRGIVGWVQDGHKPEDVPSQGSGSPKPEKPKGPLYEYKKIPVHRTRVDQVTATMMPSTDEIQRRALSMQASANIFVKEIMARSLSEDEKAADPDHDYELFNGVETLEAAKKLGWPSLDALVYEVDEFEAYAICHDHYRYTRTRTWLDTYDSIVAISKSGPDMTVAKAAILMEQDPDFVNQVLAALKLLNDSAKKAIRESICKCHVGMIDNGGYRFVEEFAVPLARLEGVSPNLLETQKLVEEVVNTAIENEIRLDDMDALVEWVLEGNDPGDFYEKEA
jgi:ParB-like chromosome segregation protein Spo0J